MVSALYDRISFSSILVDVAPALAALQCVERERSETPGRIELALKDRHADPHLNLTLPRRDELPILVCRRRLGILRAPKKGQNRESKTCNELNNKEGLKHKSDFPILG